jgi:hypothetical protein
MYLKGTCVSFYDYSLPLALFFLLFLLAAVVVAPARLLIPRTLLRAEVPSRSPDDRILLLLLFKKKKKIPGLSSRRLRLLFSSISATRKKEKIKTIYYS